MTRVACLLCLSWLVATPLVSEAAKPQEALRGKIKQLEAGDSEPDAMNTGALRVDRGLAKSFLQGHQEAVAVFKCPIQQPQEPPAKVEEMTASEQRAEWAKELKKFWASGILEIIFNGEKLHDDLEEEFKSEEWVGNPHVTAEVTADVTADVAANDAVADAAAVTDNHGNLDGEEGEDWGGEGGTRDAADDAAAVTDARATVVPFSDAYKESAVKKEIVVRKHLEMLKELKSALSVSIYRVESSQSSDFKLLLFALKDIQTHMAGAAPTYFHINHDAGVSMAEKEACLLDNIKKIALAMAIAEELAQD